MGLNEDFLSLKLGYESLIDTLKEQAQISRDYVNRAITLFSVGTGVIGIGLPIMLTRNISKFILVDHIPFTDLFFISILLYVGVVVSFRKVCKNEHIDTVRSPTIIKEDYLELEPDMFYSEMIQSIEESFDKNEGILKHKEEGLRCLVIFTIAEVIMIIIPTLLFFALRLG